MSRWAAWLLRNYTRTFLFYGLLMLALFFPYLRGDVVAPHRQTIEVGATDQVSARHAYFENRKFSDYSNAYIPEISNLQSGPRSSWLALWTNQNELGRPVYQISGFSPAYLPSWMIGRFTSNPWRFITSLSLLTCFAAGAFMLLFCRELELNPMAGLVAALGLGASPLFIYWLTFPMFPATWCWSAGCLWSISRLARRPDLLAWAGLAFSAYSLLMTSYPQLVVFQAYLLAGYGWVLAFQVRRSGIRRFALFLSLVASSLLLAGLLALPVYYDILMLVTESARIAPGADFFNAVLPKLSTISDAVSLLVLGVVPEIFGVPTQASFPLPYNGLGSALVVSFFAIVGLLAAFRRTWGWWLATGIVCLFAFLPPLYDFGVSHLGFNLSRSNPLSVLTLPLIVIAAYAVDALTKQAESTKWAVLVASACILTTIAVGIAFGASNALPIRWGSVLVMVAAALLLGAQYGRYRPFLLIASCAITLVAFSFPAMMRQDPRQIATTSTLVEKIRRQLTEGARFAIAAPGIAALPPNLNATLGLASLHSYNSLSPRRYQDLIAALGGNTSTYGRWNSAISPDYSGTGFWMSNVALVLSPEKITHSNLIYIDQDHGVWMYGVNSRMGDNLQVMLPGLDRAVERYDIGDPRRLPAVPSHKTSDRGDILEFDVSVGPTSLLILSQKYHRDWHAQVTLGHEWEWAKTVEVNHFFEGVVLPEGARHVRLVFEPLARFAWIANVFWVVLTGLLGFVIWRRHRQVAPEKA